MGTNREKLKSFIKKNCVFHGDFVLSSGQRSSLYIDLRRATLNGEMMETVGEELYEAIRTHSPEAVGGMSLGADPLVCATVMVAARRGMILHGCLVRKKAKEHGTKSRIEGLGGLAPSARVVILEDTCTTGGSSLDAAAAFREAGIQPLGIVSIVDRGGPAIAEKIKQQGLWYSALYQEAELTS